MSAVLAIDLGGTRLRAALADSADPAALTPIGEWPAPADLAPFKAMIAGLLASHGAARLGLGIPGLARGSIASWVPNLGYLDGTDMALLFPGVEIGLGNDAQFALLAEVAAGAAKGLSDAILLAIGTGIGSAVLAGGRIVKGSSGGAVSFGWAAANVDDRGDPRHGWLERHASGRALDVAARSVGLADGAALVDGARAGDTRALAALEVPMRALGTVLAGAVGLLDPEAIILAGGVAGATDVLMPPLLRAMRRQLPPHLRGIRIEPGRFVTRAGLVGAAFAGSRGRAWGSNDG